MDARLEVQITADISDLENQFKKAEDLLHQQQDAYDRASAKMTESARASRELHRELQALNNQHRQGVISQKEFAREADRIGNELKQSDLEVVKMQRELQRLNREMRRSAQEAERYAQAMDNQQNSTQNLSRGTQNLAKTTRVNAVPAMTSFSQVIQDAPYGIQGVANNIQQLTMQMGYLSRNAGGAGAAIKAMGASLVGPAGVLFAVSAVTSLMTYMSREGLSLSDVIRKLTGDFSELETAQRKVASARIEAVTDYAGEIAEVRALVDIIGDETTARENREKAINRLESIRPGLLAGLNKEALAMATLEERVNSLTTALERQAHVKVLTDTIAENQSRLRELRKQYADAAEDIASTWDVIASSVRTAWARTAIGDLLGAGDNPISNAAAQMGKYKDSINDVEEATKSLQEELRKLIEEQLNKEDELVLNYRANVTIEDPPTLEDIEVKLEIEADERQAREVMRMINQEYLDQGKIDLVKYDELDRQQKLLYDRIEEEKRLNDSIAEGINRYTGYSTEIMKENEKLLKATDAVLKENEKLFQDSEGGISDAAKGMQRAVETSINGMINSMIQGKFEAKDFARSIISSFLSIAVSNMLGGVFGGGGGLFGSIFGGGPRASNFSSPTINTSSTVKSLSSVRQNVVIPDVRIQGQDLLVVFNRASQNKSRTT